LLGHYASLHSHASLRPQFTSPGLASQALIRAGKPSFTTKRYATVCNYLKFKNKILFDELIKSNGTQLKRDIIPQKIWALNIILIKQTSKKKCL
jgi:hypothetical protein